MKLFATHSDSQCYLRLLANWGLGLAGLPLAVNEDEEPDPRPMPAEAAITPIPAN
ncbi:hypothetical protein [Stagnimonas aquatica]|uniref:hypothetical protein n=1 Tax=Stagnimonas aquatica TaxID=2689987 RepID=UPI001315725A|nr:hypothetical protein [Stagnimonas aquatica]